MSMDQGGEFIVISDGYGLELGRIGVSRVLAILPLVGAEILVRYGLSRVWRIAARSRLRRDVIASEWKQHNIESLMGLLEFGVVVAPRPDKDQP